jgi:hypothetical protein
LKTRSTAASASARASPPTATPEIFTPLGRTAGAGVVVVVAVVVVVDVVVVVVVSDVVVDVVVVPLSAMTVPEKTPATMNPAANRLTARTRFTARSV